MKKYTILDIDCSTLATEVMSYLNNNFDVESIEYRNNAFHEIPTTELSGTSLGSLFPGLTAKGIGHVTVNSDAMYNHNYGQFMIIPLADCESTVLKVFNLVEGAVEQPNPPHYLDEDCTLIDTVPLTGPVIVGSTFTLETTDLTKLSDVLMVWFNEDISSYLA